MIDESSDSSDNTEDMATSTAPVIAGINRANEGNTRIDDPNDYIRQCRRQG